MQATLVIDASKLNIRWTEPYVSHGLNRKALALPSGAYRGLWFATNGSANLRLVVDPDSLGMDLQHFGIIEDRANGYTISYRDDASLSVDCSALLTGGAAQTFYVWLAADYSVSSATTGNIIVSNVIGDIPSDAYVFLGIVNVDAGATVLNEGTNCSFDYADATNPRQTPQPTKVDAHADYVAGSKQFGFIEGQERRNLPINDEKDAMTGSTSPSSTNPFVTHACQIPVTVDVRAYGAGFSYNAITGYGKGLYSGVRGFGHDSATTNVAGGIGVSGTGGFGDGSAAGGSGSSFTGGEGGDTGIGGPGGTFTGGQGGVTSGAGGIGVDSTGGNAFGAGAGGIGIQGLGGNGSGGSNPGGSGVYGYGGSGAGLGSSGYGVYGKGRGLSAGVYGYGGTISAPGVQGLGGGTAGTGGIFSGGSVDGTGVISLAAGDGVGVVGVGGGASSLVPSDADGAGVYGIGGDIGGAGVYGQGGDPAAPGIVGLGFGATFSIGLENHGLIGQGGATSSAAGYGIRAKGGTPSSTGAGGKGGYFEGGAGATSTGGNGIETFGGDGASGEYGGTGIISYGGDGVGTTANGGRGGWFFGGDAGTSGDGGNGITAKGGGGNGLGGTDAFGVYAQGGGINGIGMAALGGTETYTSDPLGEGLIVKGVSRASFNSARGMYCTGGNSSTNGQGGIGGEFDGGDGAGINNEGGNGITSRGGSSDSGEYSGVGGHFTGGVYRGPIHLAPRAMPAGCKVGDLWIDTSGILYSCILATKTGASVPTNWQKVGLQV